MLAWSLHFRPVMLGSTVTLEEELLDLLSALGSNPDEIAATLQTADCRGLYSSPHSCPVARYLKKKLSNRAAQVSVGSKTGTVLTYDQRQTTIELSSAIRWFIRGFDDRLYPQLRE